MWPFKHYDESLPTIYLIDDDSDFIAVLEKFIKKRFTLNIISFSQPTKAFEHLLDCKVAPELVLCDLHMPEISGLQLRKKLRAHGVQIPFVFLSADQEKNISEDDYTILSKPVSMDSIEEVMAQQIHHLHHRVA